MPSDGAAETINLNPIINKFGINIATVNGSGSQSANLILMRSIFNMGIPVSGKNLFPSNIAGLPTWFTIRVDKDGYMACLRDAEILIAMNEATIDEDLAKLKPGTIAIVSDKLQIKSKRPDVTYFVCPFAELAGKHTTDPQMRKLMTNTAYVGTMAHLLGIDQDAIDQAVKKQFGKKAKAIELNLNVIRAGREWAEQNIKVGIPFRVEKMNKTQGKIIIDGNAASALGAMFAGCTFVAWYPITPSSSLPESMIGYMQKYRTDKTTKKNTYAIVQAEDEIASIGMVLGAGWAGARACTSTSGPGISLMSEFVGLSFFAEIPAVIFNVARVGPSTGLPTRTMQGDLTQIYWCSHGDTKHIMLLPGSVEECFTMGQEAFDLAEKYQTTVFVVTDLDLGMNNWMSDPFTYPTKPIQRGKVLDAEGLEKAGKFQRYKDVDGDGIPYRTLPGTKHPLAAYFTRGSGHNESSGYTEKPEDYKNLLERIHRKINNSAKDLPAPIENKDADAQVGIISYGTSDYAVRESLDQLRAQGVKASYLRVRGLPFTDDVQKFIDRHKRVYVVEQNLTAQMTTIMRAELPATATAKLHSVLHYDGIPLDAPFVTNAILAREKEF
jgi:2-oxoglutarate/2-oxoacid ferredoxin oxidoreductase subunit alpha